MTEKESARFLNDRVIKEAMRLELEGIEAPLAGRVWHNIEAHLEKAPASGTSLVYPWGRYTVFAAAACLLILLGSFGVLQVIRDDDLTAYNIRPESAEEATVFQADDEVAPVTQNLPVGREAALIQDWPVLLSGGFELVEVVISEDDGDMFFHKAYYRRSGETLLWIKADFGPIENVRFVENLGYHMKVLVQVNEETEGVLHFTVEGRQGLAWLKDESNQALWDLTGTLTAEEFINLVNSLR
ncbi:MAG TPA: hypothetical protein VLH18_01550 [Candidatus Limnocylindrales bacterium]|nr:hypothetical protein [Candidatus Limnocylindrales bacterium]